MSLDTLPRQIARFSKLARLSIANTKIKSLAPLAKLTRLEAIYFHDTGITDLSPLAATAPKLRIIKIPKNTKREAWAPLDKINSKLQVVVGQ